MIYVGATVCARSVKLLERVPNPDEPETRDSWWTELRMEIRSHARALGCNVVLGYTELTTISYVFFFCMKLNDLLILLCGCSYRDEVCVLSVTGTAAVINLQYTSAEIAILDGLSVSGGAATGITTKNSHLIALIIKNDNSNNYIGSSILDPRQDSVDNEIDINVFTTTGSTPGLITTTPVINATTSATISTTTAAATSTAITTSTTTSTSTTKDNKDSCSMCHIPYNKSAVPFNVHMKRCRVCKYISKIQ